MKHHNICSSKPCKGDFDHLETGWGGGDLFSRKASAFWGEQHLWGTR